MTTERATAILNTLRTNPSTQVLKTYMVELSLTGAKKHRDMVDKITAACKAIIA